jgi:hypothetical protein
MRRSDDRQRMLTSLSLSGGWSGHCEFESVEAFVRWRRAWRTWRPVSRGLDVALGDAHLPRLEPRRHRITRSVKQCSRGASRPAGPTASTSRVRGHARAHRSAGETGGRALRRWPPCSGPRAPGRAAPPRRHLAGARTTRMARPQAERYTLPPAGSISSSPPRFPAAQRGKRPPHVDEQERRRGGLDLPPSSRDRGDGSLAAWARERRRCRRRRG